MFAIEMVRFRQLFEAADQNPSLSLPKGAIVPVGTESFLIDPDDRSLITAGNFAHARFDLEGILTPSGSIMDASPVLFPRAGVSEMLKVSRSRAYEVAIEDARKPKSKRGGPVVAPSVAKVRFTGEGESYGFPLGDASLFPQFAPSPSGGTLTIDAREFIRLLNYATTFVANKEDGTLRTSIGLELQSPGRIRAIGSDGTALGVTESGCSLDGDVSDLVRSLWIHKRSTWFVASVVRSLDTTDPEYSPTVELRINSLRNTNDSVLITGDGFALIVPISEGVGLPYGRAHVQAKDSPAVRLKSPRKLIDAYKLCSAVRQPREVDAVTMHVRETGVVLANRTEQGAATVEIEDAEIEGIEGDPRSFDVNGVRVVRFLELFDQEMPIVVKTDADPAINVMFAQGDRDQFVMAKVGITLKPSPILTPDARRFESE